MIQATTTKAEISAIPRMRFITASHQAAASSAPLCPRRLILGQLPNPREGLFSEIRTMAALCASRHEHIVQGNKKAPREAGLKVAKGGTVGTSIRWPREVPTGARCVWMGGRTRTPQPYRDPALASVK
jgi:hypothetical protein